jgi:hypothetical protein
VLSSPPKPSAIRLPTSSGIFLLRRLLSAYSCRFSLSAAKPTQSGGARSAATSARMSGFCTSSIVRRRRLFAFLDLLRDGSGGAVIGDGGDGDEDVAAGDLAVHRGVHLQGAADLDAVDALRAGQADRAGDQRHLGSRFAGGAGNGIAHLAGRQVGDSAYRVDRLEGRPGGQQHALAGEPCG